ncbi:hypothetical protein [Pedobacter sp. SYSU D00535]|uniref:hypothetical protein n=1 Tax=Pedobacter sp. SYSU D00535 TaxID=2810308 RepID=UPI001A964CF8|nr:hypothetical protein [Pedobacter sp. SYSU D00535]
MNTELATPVKGTSWTDLIVAIEVGGEGYFPYEKAATIRPLISGRVKDKYPERAFEATKGEKEIDGLNQEVLVVKRIK